MSANPFENARPFNSTTSGSRTSRDPGAESSDKFSRWWASLSDAERACLIGAGVVVGLAAGGGVVYCLAMLPEVAVSTPVILRVGQWVAATGPAAVALAKRMASP